MISPKSPIPMHPHFGAKNTSLDPVNEEEDSKEVKTDELKEESKKKKQDEISVPEEAKDEIHIDAKNVVDVEGVNEIPEGAEVHDGVVLDGTDEEVDAVLDTLEVEAKRKKAVAEAPKE